MEKRIVRLEGESWRIRTELGELPKSEEAELKEYFDEIRMPYKIEVGSMCISGRVDREAMFERMAHFYDGRTEVLPF